MTTSPSATFLVLASQFKGERFMAECHRRGVKVHVLTKARLLGEPWPRDVLADVHALPDHAPLPDLIRGVSWLARRVKIDRVVALDDFDVEVAGALREHLRLPGMGESAARLFRDKLAMRVRAQEAGIPEPRFSAVLHWPDLEAFLAAVPGPWMLKPRSQASATGIRKVQHSAELWSTLDHLGDGASQCVLEEYVPGDIYHVDSLVVDGEPRFMEVHKNGRPPFDVAHGGGVWTTRTVLRGAAEDTALRELNTRVLKALGLTRGAAHAEFIHARDGRFLFMEVGARVGGANIADVVEAASGVNLWEEWARLETDPEAYQVPARREEYAGVALTLARQEWPDYAAYQDPEVAVRIAKRHHAGLVLRASDAARVHSLLDQYAARFAQDFGAVLPALEHAD